MRLAKSNQTQASLPEGGGLRRGSPKRAKSSFGGSRKARRKELTEIATFFTQSGDKVYLKSFEKPKSPLLRQMGVSNLPRGAKPAPFITFIQLYYQKCSLSNTFCATIHSFKKSLHLHSFLFLDKLFHYFKKYDIIYFAQNSLRDVRKTSAHLLLCLFTAVEQQHMCFTID